MLTAPTIALQLAVEPVQWVTAWCVGAHGLAPFPVSFPCYALFVPTAATLHALMASAANAAGRSMQGKAADGVQPRTARAAEQLLAASS